VGGLSGGQINGDVNVTGAVSADGRLLTYPRRPMVLTGVAPQGCAPASWNGTAFASYTGMVQFPVTFNLGRPAILATLDTNSAGDIGATTIYLTRAAGNRVSFGCNNTATAVHWFAIDEGVHSIGTPAKHIEARSTAASQSGNVTFTAGTFTSEPVVFLQLDDSGGAGANFARVTLNTTNVGFSYSLDAAPSAGQVLHWVAMDRGTYFHGRYVWTADYITGACTTNCPFNITLSTSPTVILTLHDTDGANLPTFVRLLSVSPTQFTYRIGGNATERVNYLTVEDLPEVLTLP
jgi:hypothetical protein